MSREPRYVRPLALQISVWSAVAFLTVYGASHVRDEITKSEELGQVEWLADVATSAMKLSDTLGLSALDESLQDVRKAINAPYTVLEAEPVEEPPPPPDVEPPPPPVAEPGALPHHVGARKRRVLVIGASSIQFAVGVEFEKRLPTYDGVKVKRFGQLATGLSRPDFMDWPKKLEALASQFKPDLVITNFGGNDAQAIPVGKYDKTKFTDPGWDDEYAKRVKEIIDISKKHGADVVMLGMPIMRKVSFKEKITRLNRVTKKTAEAEGALYISTYEMASTPDGEYRKTIEYNGKRGLMRTSDGIHYTRLGAQYVVEQVMQAIQRRYRFVDPEPELAVPQPHGFESEILGERVDYVAYVPRGEGEKFSWVVMTPKPAWSEWPNHPHRALQRAAQSRKQIVVLPKEAPPPDVLSKELMRDVKRHLPVDGDATIVEDGAAWLAPKAAPKEP